ncbi:MAG: hypothetical protein ACRD82_06745 [Blastocatellia bacterium]
MISQAPSNPTSPETVAHSRSLLSIKQFLRHWLDNPLTVVFMVWGVLFLALGLFWFLFPLTQPIFRR